MSFRTVPAGASAADAIRRLQEQNRPRPTHDENGFRIVYADEQPAARSSSVRSAKREIRLTTDGGKRTTIVNGNDDLARRVVMHLERIERRAEKAGGFERHGCRGNLRLSR